VAELHGFAGEEWDLLTETPLAIFLAIMNADVAVDSMDEERVAFEKWVEHSSAECKGSAWMAAALSDVEHPTATQAHGFASVSESELLPQLEQLAAALSRHVPPEEAQSYKRLLLTLAERVAAASAGPFPGGPRVTKAEGDLIWKIRRALGV
jgi:hypothetical protein